MINKLLMTTSWQLFEGLYSKKFTLYRGEKGENVEMNAEMIQAIGNIKKVKSDLEDKILDLLLNFEVQTGLKVEAVYIQKGFGAKTLKVQVEVVML